MNISRKSWHYRLVCFIENTGQKEKHELKDWNLCVYFWLIVLSPIFFTVLLVLLLAFFTAKLLFLLFRTPVIIMWRAAVWMIPARETSRGLFLKWIWAQKRKVCPLLEFTD